MARVHGPRQHGQHRLQPEGLQHVIKRAHLHCIDRSLDRALAGHHDADQIRIYLRALVHQRDAICAGHHQIRKHYVESLPAQHPERFFASSTTNGFVALRDQCFDEDIL